MLLARQPPTLLSLHNIPESQYHFAQHIITLLVAYDIWSQNGTSIPSEPIDII